MTINSKAQHARMLSSNGNGCMKDLPVYSEAQDPFVNAAQRQQLLNQLQLQDEDVTVHYSDILGEGGFGVVYLGDYRPSTGVEGGSEDRKVAVKLVEITHDLLPVETQLLALFNNELLVLSVLASHPNVLKCFGYMNRLLEDGSLKLVLELSPYGSLSSLLYDSDRFPQLPCALRLVWCMDIIGAVDFMHVQHLIHRDLNADNCLLFPNLQLKLCDFGLALHHSTEDTRFVGTKEFVAPEIYSGKNARTGSDVYSFAMMLLQIFLRDLPGRPDNASALLSHTSSSSSKKRLQDHLSERCTITQEQIMHVMKQVVEAYPVAAESCSALQTLLLACLHYDHDSDLEEDHGSSDKDAQISKRPSSHVLFEQVKAMVQAVGGDPRISPTHSEHATVQALEHKLLEQAGSD